MSVNIVPTSILPTLLSFPEGPANRLVAVLVYDQLCSFEFGCAVEIFGLPRPEFGERWYEFVTCAADSGPMRAVGGMTVVAEADLSVLARAGTVIIPGWKGADVAPSPELITALRAAHAAGARLVTICSGVFVLAAAGILTNEKVTTHWRYADKLQATYPQLTVDANVLYVDAGQILTSAGSAAGLDLCLHLVRRDYGPRIANQVARRLVMAPHRNGGQAQFIERPLQGRPDNRLSDVIANLAERVDEPFTIASMARAAAMSPRTFMRRFREATGRSPAEWLIDARVERARELLETTHLGIDAIASRCGFGAAATLRHHFRRKLTLSPLAYRERFAREFLQTAD